MYLRLLSLFLLLSFFFPFRAEGEEDALRRKLDRIVRNRQAETGVAFLCGDRHFAFNDEPHYPLMSVFKIHVALAVLEKLESEGTDLRTEWFVAADRMKEDTYSPLRDLHPGEDFRISVEELIRYCLSESDNNACDLLIDYAGGIRNVERQMRAWGVADCFLTETEADMHADVMNSYRNRSRPSSVVHLLRRVYGGERIGGPYLALFEQAMRETTTGPDKMRSGLPSRVALGHKTGSSDRLADGTKIGDNDAGVVCLSGGRRLFLAVFVKDSRETDAANARLIARITKIVYRAVRRGRS